MTHDVISSAVPPINLVRKSDIAHKVNMGILFDAYYDTETTDLNKRFAEITQFGGVVADLAGNILHTVDYRAKISPYTVMSPYAWLVQRMQLEDLDKGDARAIFMGKVSRFFDDASNLPSAPYANTFLLLCRKGKFTNNKNETDAYYSYPVLNDDGTVDWDYLRIDGKLKKFYFKDVNGQWVKRDIHAMTIGYNNINADDNWLWTAAHMAGRDNIFMTHLPNQGKYRLDALRVVESIVVAGGGGQNGLRAPTRIDPRTHEESISFSLGAIIEANTRLASELRGITEGIIREDKSHVDLSQLHGALEDSLTLLALMKYIRAHHPDILRQMESNSDWKHVVHKLTDIEGGFGNNPPMAYVDKIYPTVDGKMISLIGTDQHRNAPKVAVVWNLSIDPKTYTYNGKSVDRLTPFEWKQILSDAPNNPNSPLKIIRTHKSPRILDAETGYASGFNLGMDRVELNGRIRHIRNLKIEKDVMSGYRLAFPRLHGIDRIVLPQPEEELFTFSTLELFDAKHGEDVQVHHRIQNKVEDIAQKSRDHIIKVKALWLRAIHCDEELLWNEHGSINDFLKKIENINKELKNKHAPLVPQPDEPVIDTQSALFYKIKILFYARNYFASGQIQDIGHHFCFEDADGIRYSDKDVQKWSHDKVDEARHSGNLHVRHERVNVMPLIIDRMIEELGYGHLLGGDVRLQQDAFQILRQTGIPHYHGYDSRWYTVAQAHKDVAKIEQNEIMDADISAMEYFVPGARDKFIGNHHDNLASLEEYKQYLKTVDGRSLAPVHMRALGIDPQTKLPLPRYDFAVHTDKPTEVIEVPDRYIENPSIDPITGRPVWILPSHEAFHKSAKLDDINVLFRAAASRKVYHFPMAQKLSKTPLRGGVYQDFYKAVDNAYFASGLKPPSFKSSMAVIGNGPYPLHDLRPIKPSAQSLNIPKIYFEGMVSPMISGFEKAPRGIIIRDDNLKIAEGAVRLCEANDNSQPTGWEYETDIVNVQKIALEDVEKFTDTELSRFGFQTIDQAIDTFSKLFANQQKNPKDKRNKALAISFGDIRPDDQDKGVMYYKPGARVHSSVIQPHLPHAL